MKIGYLMQEGVPDIRSTAPSGPANHVIHTIKGLRRLGHDVRVLANLEGGTSYSEDLERFERVRLPGLEDGPRRLIESGVRRVQSELHLPYLSYFDSRRFAAACAQKLADCDVLYERMGWMGAGGSRAARALGVPHVIEINGDHLEEFEMLGVAPRGAQRWASLAVMGRVTRSAAHAVAAGEGWRRRHVERWGTPLEKVSVVENGTAMVDMLAPEQLRCRRNGVDGPQPLRLIYVGGFDPWQGLPGLLETTAIVAGSGVDVTLTLAGAGNLDAELRRKTAELGLGEWVRFTGHLAADALAAELAQADAGVVLYQKRKEYSGLKLLDYKAAGLATIAVGANGQPALIEHERTGLIIPPNDLGALEAAIRRLAGAPQEAKRMGRAAREEAERMHSWSHTAQAIEAVLERVRQEAQR